MERTVIRLNGAGGELDKIVLLSPASNEAIDAAVLELMERCTFAVGDTITITEEV